MLHSTKADIRDRCDGTNKVTERGLYGKSSPGIKNKQEAVIEADGIIIDIHSDDSNQ